MRDVFTLLGSLALAFCAGADTVVLEETNASAIPDTNTALVRTLVFTEPQRVVTRAELELDLLHEWVGDLVITLTSPDGTTVRIIDRPGTVPSGFPGPWGCGGDDILATFTDDASLDVLDACSITGVPVYAGDIRPADALTAFVGTNPLGDWIVSVRDAQSGDAGTLRGVRLVLEIEDDCDLDGVPDACAACLGDFDSDGDVDLGDFGLFGAAFGSQEGDSAYDADADFDADGDVDLGDFGLFGGEFGRTDCS